MNYKIATFGSGCFWCTEAIFEIVEGVKTVKSGYSGGNYTNPTYKLVTSGITNHAEVVQIEYDPNIISYIELLEIFWKTHDPTTINRQGNDVGTQYRSIILYHNEEQKKLANEYKIKLDKSGAYDKPLVTQIPIGIEASLKEAIPEIANVIDATDHASGDNPYFAGSKK